MIFVHRDADNIGIAPREREISRAAGHHGVADRVLPVIPVSMLETWLLADVDAIRRVAGNRNPRSPIKCLPPLKRLEAIKDSKALLLTALCEASETEGSKLDKFKKRFPEMRARLTFDLNPDGPVNELPSYRQFREVIYAFAVQKLATEP